MEEQAKYEVATREGIELSGSMFFNMEKFEHAQRIAQMFSASDLVPMQFRKSIPNCMIALNLAERMRVEPFMLMQSMYVVHGRPGIEAKLAIGLINAGRRFDPIEYETEGEDPAKKPYRVRAFAKEHSTKKVLYGPWISWDMVEAEGWHKPKGDNKTPSKWMTIPELMFRYRAASWFVRTNDPGVLLGLHTTDELEDIIDITPEPARTLKVEGNEKPQGEIYRIKETEPKVEAPSQPEAPATVQVSTEPVKEPQAPQTETKRRGRSSKPPEAPAPTAPSPKEPEKPLFEIEEQPSDPFVTEAEQYQLELSAEAWDQIVRLHGVKGVPIKDFPKNDEARKSFLSRCKKQMELQKAKD